MHPMFRCGIVLRTPSAGRMSGSIIPSPEIMWHRDDLLVVWRGSRDSNGCLFQKVDHSSARWHKELQESSVTRPTPGDANPRPGRPEGWDDPFQADCGSLQDSSRTLRRDQSSLEGLDSMSVRTFVGQISDDALIQIAIRSIQTSLIRINLFFPHRTSGPAVSRP